MKRKEFELRLLFPALFLVSFTSVGASSDSLTRFALRFDFISWSLNAEYLLADGQSIHSTLDANINIGKENRRAIPKYGMLIQPQFKAGYRYYLLKNKFENFRGPFLAYQMAIGNRNYIHTRYFPIGSRSQPTTPTAHILAGYQGKIMGRGYWNAYFGYGITRYEWDRVFRPSISFDIDLGLILFKK